VTAIVGRTAGEDGQALALGAYRAPDGSTGAPVALDCDRPHAGVVVGKRGYGKSYTLGVIAEGLAAAGGVAPVVVDPMGVFGTLAETDAASATVHAAPTVRADALPAPAWCELLGLDPTDAAGALVWRAATAASSLSGMRDHVADAAADETARRAAENHLALAGEWGVFAADGLAPADCAGGEITVLDCSGYAAAPANAVLRATARGLYDARVEGTVDRLPWLLVDEAHVFFDGVAGPALRTLLSRGRQPGVSLVAATQRPSALPAVAVSQSDLVIAHRLTARADREALAAARPSFAEECLLERLPRTPGGVTVVDDATESVHEVQIRERATPHGGDAPRASDLVGGE